MKFSKAVASISLLVILLLFSTQAFAENSNDYLNNKRWITSSSADIDDKYNNGEKFITVFYRTTCGNCKYMGTQVFNSWMDDYVYSIYGVDVDLETINGWAREASGGSTVTLPLVVFVDNKEVITFQGASEDNVKLLNNTFSSFIKEEPVNDIMPTIRVKSDSVYKNSVVTVFAEGTDIPTGYYLAVYDTNGNLLGKGNQYFAKYTFPEKLTKSSVLIVKIVNDDGVSFCDNERNEISQRIEITIKNGFFDNIVAFFKWLFKSNEITIAP